MIKSVLVLLSVALLVSCESGLGGCPSTVTSQPVFDATSFFGRWYEIARYNFTFEADGFCTNAHYNLTSDGTIMVVNEERYGAVDGPIERAVGQATVPDSTKPAQLEVTFNSSPFAAPYWVLETDYDNFALIWSCTDFGLFHLDYAWILSRTPTMDSNLLSKLVAKWQSIGVDVNYFYYTPQKGCTY